MHEPTVQGDTRALLRGINRLGSSRPGPMSWGPADGHIRFYAADGRTLFSADATGASVEHRGSLTGLTPLLNANSDKNDAQDGRLTGAEGRLDDHDSTLAAHSGRLTEYGQAITGLGTRMGSAESTISAHGTRLTEYGQAITGLGTRMGAAESKNASQDSTLSSHNSRISTAQSRADNAHSDAATAQARADDAYSLAAGAADSGTVDSLISQLNQAKADIVDLQERVSDLENWRNSLPDA